MNTLDALILGIVEGITEFLPISSTGHLILFGHILQIADSDFVKSFEIIIQLGAILAIVWLYRDLLFRNAKALLRILVAFVPTAVIGILLYMVVKKYLLGNDVIVVCSLFVGGLALIYFESWSDKRLKQHKTGSEGATLSTSVSSRGILEEVTYRKAMLIGLWQSLAIVPGVSRSAATIVGGEIIGISRKTIVEFSFLLAVPTMLAASGLDLIKHYNTFAGSDWATLSVGFITAFLVAIIAVRSFLGYIQKHSFRAFGYYRIIIALIYALVFLL